MFGLSPQILILTSAMAVSALGGWRITANHYQAEIAGMRADKARAALEAVQLNRKLELMALDLSGVISERDAARKQKARIVERETTRRVIEYVKSPVPKCAISSDWVSIHNASASGGVPEDASTTGPVDDPARAVTDDIALAVIVTNYQICDATRSQLIGLQEWAAGIQEINNEH